MINFQDAFIKLLSGTSSFNEKLPDIFFEANTEFIKKVFEGNNITKDIPELEKILSQRTNQIFQRFRDKMQPQIVYLVTHIWQRY